MRDFIDNARLAVAYMPTRVFVWAIVVLVVLVWLAGCAAVQFRAELDARCTFKRAAPFRVVCLSDGKPVLDWGGPMALDVQEAP